MGGWHMAPLGKISPGRSNAESLLSIGLATSRMIWVAFMGLRAHFFKICTRAMYTFCP